MVNMDTLFPLSDIAPTYRSRKTAPPKPQKATTVTERLQLMVQKAVEELYQGQKVRVTLNDVTEHRRIQKLSAGSLHPTRCVWTGDAEVEGQPYLIVISSDSSISSHLREGVIRFAHTLYMGSCLRVLPPER